MKKLTFIFVLVILITITPLTAHANYNNENGNIIDGTQSVNADLEEDKDKIMKSALEDIREHYGDDSIDENVIDLNKAIKVNFYMPFLEKDDLTLESMPGIPESPGKLTGVSKERSISQPMIYPCFSHYFRILW